MNAPANSLALTPVVFRRIAAIARSETGINLPATKIEMIRSRLSRRVRTLGLSDFENYCRVLEDRSDPTERQAFINAITTNVTRFFREPHHFRELGEEVVPQLVEANRKGRRVRIWSAACSTGEEPYSIALTIAKEAPDLLDGNFRILATDIDDAALARAHAGRFDQDALAPAPGESVAKHFVRDGEALVASPSLRRCIVFKRLNLIGSWPMKGRFQAIFCRNALIYFDAETQRKIISGFADRLTSGDALFLGHSERVHPALEEKFARAGMTSYRRV